MSTDQKLVLQKRLDSSAWEFPWKSTSERLYIIKTTDPANGSMRLIGNKLFNQLLAADDHDGEPATWAFLSANNLAFACR